jgi:pyruvate formate lyase activating enzyme
VFFKGCPLKCNWCANPESINREIEIDSVCQTYGKEYTAEELLEEVIKDKVFYDKSGGGVTLSGGEALLQADFLDEFIGLCHQNSIHVAIETSLYVKSEIIKRFINKIDYWFVDIKHYDEQRHIKGTGVSNKQIIENIKLLPDVHIRIPVIPGYNDSVEDAQGFAHLLKELGITQVELLPFHQFGEKKYELLGRDYPFKGVKQLHKEDLQDFIHQFDGIEVKI